MEIVRFTKFWRELGVEGLGERAARLGYDGLDLVVREGFAVHPGNVSTELPRAVRAWSASGIRCPLVTAGVDLVDPRSRAARSLYAAAAEAGVVAVKMGYFVYRPGAPFEAVWDEARRALAGFEALSRDTGVRTLYHTHSGLCLGSNCGGLRHLLEGLDPARVGAYVDPGHLAVNGEDARLALPMVRERLGAVAAKDARHVPDRRPRARAGYTDAFVPLGEGAAEWGDVVGLLRSWDYRGPISVHTEYTHDPEVAATVGGRDDSPASVALRERGEVRDLAYLRRLWDEAR